MPMTKEKSADRRMKKYGHLLVELYLISIATGDKVLQHFTKGKYDTVEQLYDARITVRADEEVILCIF